MRDLLIVYCEVNLQNANDSRNENDKKMVTLSVDEKPGIQAIKNVTPGLPPQHRGDFLMGTRS